MANKQIRLNQIQQDGATSNQVIKWNGTNWAPAADDAGGGVSDGDKGDITVSSSGTVWTIDNNAVTNAKINDVAWSKVTGTPTTLSGYGITDSIIIQNGNSFGTTMVIGTNDNNMLQLETNSVSRVQIDQSGQTRITNTTAGTLFPVEVLSLNHNSTGTPSAGFGTRLSFRAKSSSTNDTDIGLISNTWLVETHASRRSEMTFGVVGLSQSLQNVFKIYSNTTPSLQISKGGSFSVGNNTDIAEYRANSILPGTDGFTLGNNVNNLTISGSGEVNIISTSQTADLVIAFNQTTSTRKINIGNSFNYNQTSGVKVVTDWTTNFNPTSGTAEFTQLNIGGTINQTGGANGISRGIKIEPTLTAINNNYIALDIPVNNVNALGINQTGANTTNVIVGRTMINGTGAPDSRAAIEFAGSDKAIFLPKVSTVTYGSWTGTSGALLLDSTIGNQLALSDTSGGFGFIPRFNTALVAGKANKFIVSNNTGDYLNFSDAFLVNSNGLTVTTSVNTTLTIESTGDLTSSATGSPSPHITFKATNNNLGIQQNDVLYRFGFDGRTSSGQKGFLPLMVSFASTDWTNSDIRNSVVFFNSNNNPNHLGTSTVNEVFGFTATGDIRTYWNGGLYLDSSNATQGVLLKANATTNSYTITLPSAAPGSNTYLKYNGSAYVWDTASGGASDTLDLTTVPSTDTANGIRASFTAGETLAFGEVVYVRNSTGAKVFKYDANDTTVYDTKQAKTFTAIGVATAAIASGNAGNILLQGVIRKATGWTWTIGQPVYASIIAGGLSQTAPATSGDVVQIIGIAIASDAIYVNPQLVTLQLT